MVSYNDTHILFVVVTSPFATMTMPNPDMNWLMPPLITARIATQFPTVELGAMTSGPTHGPDDERPPSSATHVVEHRTPDRTGPLLRRYLH
jgi:hypothetical protein